MATFVLVHGAWAGGWCWRYVARALRASGYDVYMPTLTGMGERAHLLHPDVDLTTHIKDIANLLFYEDLSDVVLVGWSYAGMVITGVAEQAADRLAHLVYLDADVPQHGQSRFDLETPDGRAFWETEAHTHGDGWHVPLTADESALRDVVPDDAERRWIAARFVGQSHPLKTLTEPVEFTNPTALALPRTYLSCTVGVADLYARMAEYARVTPGWGYREIGATHFAPFSHPQEVADMLLEAVE